MQLQRYFKTKNWTNAIQQMPSEKIEAVVATGCCNSVKNKPIRQPKFYRAVLCVFGTEFYTSSELYWMESGLYTTTTRKVETINTLNQETHLNQKVYHCQSISKSQKNEFYL